MKRLGNLYNKIISLDNLKLADEKARQGKLHSYGVRVHDRNREQNIINLHEALKNKTFKTSRYTCFTIYEPKERLIFRLPYYPDRIVHHAIMNVLEPILTKIFTSNTYSCIKGRGIEGCAKKVGWIIKSHSMSPKLYCLKIDIKKFYPSVNHEILKTIVRKKIKDKDLLWLLDGIIDSAESGLPIGNYLSQFLSNLYLSYFMHWVNENLTTEVKINLGLSEKPRIDCTEYADDIVFIAEKKEYLWETFRLIKIYIETKLDLKIKENWQIFPIADTKYSKNGRALDYVGYQFFRKQKLIRKRIKKNLCRKVARLNKLSPSLDPKSYKKAISPWLGWAKHSNSRHLLKSIIKKEYHASIL